MISVRVVEWASCLTTWTQPRAALGSTPCASTCLSTRRRRRETPWCTPAPAIFYLRVCFLAAALARKLGAHLAKTMVAEVEEVVEEVMVEEEWRSRIRVAVAVAVVVVVVGGGVLLGNRRRDDVGGGSAAGHVGEPPWLRIYMWLLELKV